MLEPIVQQLEQMNHSRSYEQSLKKAQKTSSGRWSKPEHDRFMKGLEKYGRDWVSVQKMVKTRTLTQVRSHAQKVFLKMSQRDIDSLTQGKNSDLLPMCQKNQEIPETVKANTGASGQNYHKSKERAVKNEPDLVDLFMHAIEHEEKQPIPHSEKTAVGESNLPHRLNWPVLGPEAWVQGHKHETASWQHSKADGEDCSEQEVTYIGLGQNSYGVFPIEIDLSQHGYTC